MTTPNRTPAERMALDAGFEIWTTGGGCMAFAKTLQRVKTGDDDYAALELMITDDCGTSIDFEPDEPVWFAGISYIDPRGGDEVVSSRRNLTLSAAIEAALELAADTEAHWEKHYDAEAIEAVEAERRTRRSFF